eukprot:jgi/Bigna1/138958/aug1.47_g13666
MGDADSSAGSCFDSVYVKWLEAAGARVMPILYDWPPEKLEHAFKSVNAILFTGGGEPLTNMSSQFMQTSMKLFNLTIEANKKQDYFPLWLDTPFSTMMAFYGDGDVGGDDDDDDCDCACTNVQID